MHAHAHGSCDLFRGVRISITIRLSYALERERERESIRVVKQRHADRDGGVNAIENGWGKN